MKQPDSPSNSPAGDEMPGRSERRAPWSKGAESALAQPISPGDAVAPAAAPSVPLVARGEVSPPALPVEDIPGPRAIDCGASGLYAEVAPERGELRIDVDGPDPLGVASGVIVSGLADRLEWIANVTAAGDGVARWHGEIWHKDGTAALLPHQQVEITVAAAADQREATVRFSGGVTDRVRTYRRLSTRFHEVEIEFDAVEGVQGITAIDTAAHPNRPAGLAAETLTIEDAFRRAGFDTRVTPAGSAVPLTLTGADAVWNDTELHDAMQIYWSRFASKAQWSTWVLFASLHEEGTELGGSMFDDIGPNQRQGTAIFNDSFIGQAPADDAAPEAWVRRMRFWTAVHEMGHAFNLAHSWQKSQKACWLPLVDEPEIRSFMNYPFYVKGGQTAYFSDFAYRFSDQELLFLRHAPERFVEMGGARWFDDHGFRQAEVSPEPRFRLKLRVNRPQAVFDFLEPCMIELKFENVADDVQLVSDDVLADAEHLVIIIKKDGAPARRWLPFARQCRRGRRVVLQPGEAIYQALFAGAGRNGWDLAEPGLYTVQAALRARGEDHVSNPLRLKILTPNERDDERLAQDLLTQDVGRVLAFDGSRVLDGANAVLREAAERLPARPVARHALVALHRPLMHPGKVLRMPDRVLQKTASAAVIGAGLETVRADPDAARAGLEQALFDRPEQAAETLGNIEFKAYADRLVDDLTCGGEAAMAADFQERLHATLRVRKVAPAVIAEADGKRAVLAAAGGRRS